TLQPERARAGELCPQLRRHLARLLPVAASDADQARLEGVVVVRRLEIGELLQQPTDLRRRELLVRDAAQGRQLLGPTGSAPRRHHRLLIPCEHGDRAAQVVDLGQSRPQLVEFLAHGGGTLAHAPCAKARRTTCKWAGTTAAGLEILGPAGPCSSGVGFRPRPSPTVRSVGQSEGEVFLRASPPARPFPPRNCPLSPRPDGFSAGWLPLSEWSV